MVWYSAYLSGDGKEEVVDFIKTQRPGLTTGAVEEIDLKITDTAIFSYLYKFGRIKGSYDGVSGSVPSPTDQLNFLWAASLAYMCEFMAYRGIIHFNVGGIQESKVGDLRTRFMRMQPMFFMGNNPRNLNPVQPFRSFKQIAEQFLDSYILLYNNESGSQPARPIIAWDPTSRGYGAIADLDDYMRTYDVELTGTDLGISR